jgi:phosphatidylinositol-3,4,5-trisphosphate 3-phosphatase/dual-specificity protein phosphatase PTEN
MLSLSELPPPPQLDTSLSQSELALRSQNQDKLSQSQQRDGWVVVGSGNAVAEIPVHDGDETEELDGFTTPAHSERTKVKNGSTTSSLTTLSRSSSSASGQVGVSTEPEYDPIDVGDEQNPGTDGQRDRANGKVDAVF